MAYNLEEDIKGLGKRGRKKGAKKRAANKKFREEKAKKDKKENWVERLKRKTQMLLKGKDYKSPAMLKKEKAKKKKKKK